jgi:hypothetical protein
VRIVNDGSLDDTATVVEALRGAVLRFPRTKQ